MSERARLLELLRLLAAAGYIDGKVFIREDDLDAQVRAHVSALDVRKARRRHLASV